MFRILSSIYLLLAVVGACLAQTSHERVTAITDKQCYLAGERINVRVDVADAISPSGIAYIEVSDTQQMVAQAMVTLTEGQGWAEIELPVRLHSGTYQLTAYTRAMRNEGEPCYFRCLLGVVNGEQLSRRDNICFVPDSLLLPSILSQTSTGLLPDLAQMQVCKPLAEVNVPLPANVPTGCSVTLERNALRTNLPLPPPAHESLLPSVPEEHRLQSAAEASHFFAPEFEGHIVQASPVLEGSYLIASSRLALVGKTASLYDGQQQPDGSYLYYTHGITGNLPTLVNAYDSKGHPVPMQITSPYAQALPASLPELQVCCEEKELLERASAARRQVAVNDWLRTDTLKHSIGFMSAQPHHFYDLDEYTHMSTIRELLVEFVRGVDRRRENGKAMLFTYIPEMRAYSRWPALVLLDGMPVQDIDEILDYDAHLVKYVQIYTDRFFFGHSCCQGIISFITRGGRLSNYKLDVGSQLVSYAFPQDHPTFVPHTTKCPSSGCYHSTLIWEPVVRASNYKLRAPAAPGCYLLTIQGYQEDGTLYRMQSELEVRYE